MPSSSRPRLAAPHQRTDPKDPTQRQQSVERFARLVQEAGDVSALAARTGLARETLRRAQRAPWRMKGNVACVLASQCHASVDWLFGFPVARALEPRTVAEGALTHEETERAIYDALAESPGVTARGLLPAHLWRALERWGRDESLLPAVELDMAERIRQNARFLVSERLLRFVDEIERFRAALLKRMPDLAVLTSDRHARQLRAEALLLRQGDQTVGPPWPYFDTRPAFIDDINAGKAQTRFAVVGGIAWGIRTPHEDEVLFLSDDLSEILHVKRRHRDGRLLRLSGDDWPKDFFDLPSKRRMALVAEDRKREAMERTATPPEGATVLHRFNHVLRDPLADRPIAPPPKKHPRAMRSRPSH